MGPKENLIEGNFQREWFKQFLVRSIIFKCLFEVFISILSLQIKIIMFSKGLMVHHGGGSLAWFPSMKLPGLWRFSLTWRENLNPTKAVDVPETQLCSALTVSQSSLEKVQWAAGVREAHFRERHLLKAKEHSRIAQYNTAFYDDRNVFHLHCPKQQAAPGHMAI